MISARLAFRDKGNGTRILRCIILVWVCLISVPEQCVAEGESCAPCPPGCDCGEESPGLDSCLVDCGQKNLLNYPDFLPQPHSSISTLIIKENVIKSIPRNALDNLTNLVMIDASNNVISNIPDYLFLNLTNLEELNLLGNRLSLLNPAVFAGLINLKKLILTRNNFVHLPRGVFDELPSLETLAINVMHMKSIEGRIFQANPHLQNLYMNRLSLARLPVDLFVGLHELTHLKRTQQYYHYRPRSPGLELSVNSLTTLPEGILDHLPALTHLALSSNPWSCDCELYWLTTWIKTKQEAGLLLEYEAKTVCLSPEFYVNQTITSLKREDLNCSLFINVDTPPVDQLRQFVQPESFPPKSDRFVRSAAKTRQILRSVFKSSWKKFCRAVGKKLPSCTGPDIFISCDPNSDGDLKPVEFSQASYHKSLSGCKAECFRSGLPFGLLHSDKVCLCGSLLTKTCAETCDPKPTAYQAFCGKHYLPQAFLITADLSVSTIDTVSTSSTTQFTASTSLPVDQYTWDFGTDGNETSSSGSVQFSYFYPGDYLLTVTVSAGLGTESAKIPVRVRDDQPNINLVCNSPMDVTDRANISLTISSGYDLKTSWFRQDGAGIIKNGKSCDRKWLSYRGRCILASTTQANYSDAERECNRDQGKLLSLNFPEEIKEVADLLHLTSTSYYLIGAVRSTTTSNFVWTVSNKPARLINDKRLNPTEGDCVTLSTAGFTAVKCDSPRPFICQKDPVDCYEGGRVGPDGYCYVLSESPATWDIAKTECETFPDGGLAITHSDTVHRFVSYVILDTSSETEAWIGLNDKGHEGYFTWTDDRGQDDDDIVSREDDDDDDDDDSAVSSTKWSSSHSGLFKADQKDCVMLQKEGSVFTWIEAECSSAKHYFCRYSNHGEDITVGSYGAGTLVFPGTLQEPVQLTPLLSPSSTPPSQITVLPGLWFSDYGQLDSWEFMTGTIPTAVYLNLLVLRPYCSSGMHLTKPGCLNNPLPYSVCLSTSSSCNAVKSCPEMSRYCSLNSDCVGMREPCGCQPLSSIVPGCTSAPSVLDFSINAPEYMVVDTVNVQLRLGKTRYRILNHSLDIEEWDVLGFQHDTASWKGILCQSDSSSKWRQTIYTWSSAGWTQKGSLLTVPSSVSQNSDSVCFLRTKFYKPVIVPVTPILNSLSSPGVYKFTVEVTGGIHKMAKSCEVTAEEKVVGLEIIYPPPINSTKSTLGSVGTIPIEYREISTIVIRVAKGSHLQAYWKHLKPNKVDFSPTCPGSLSLVPGCQGDSSLATEPFSSITLRLDTTSPMSSLEVTVKNDISSSVVLVDLEKAFRIHGLKVSLTKKQKHVIDSVGVVHVPANTHVNFRTTIGQGSSVTYTWSVDGVHKITIKRYNKFQFVFSTPGKHVVQVNASNLINKEINQITVFAVQEALFKNLAPADFSEIVERGKVVTMSFTVDVMIGADVEIEVSFGYGSVSQVNTVVTTSLILQELVNHVYQLPGQHKINVTFSDMFQSVSLVRNITVINPLTNITITSTDSVIAISKSAKFHVKVSGNDIGDIWHTWDFTDGLPPMNYTGLNTLVRHKFNKPGSYAVLVMVFNDVSSLSETVNITIEEEITGLTLTYDGPKASHLPVDFTISLNTGTNILFDISTGDGDFTSTSLFTFSHLYRQPGVFNVSVSAHNPVSGAITMLSVYALGADMLEVVDILAPMCAVTNTPVNLTATVINTAPVSLYYTWQFGDKTSYNAKDKPSTEHIYKSPGQYKVEVFVNNTVKTKTATADVCIQDEVTGLQLTCSSPVGFFHGSSDDSLALASVKSGTNVTFTWDIKSPTGPIIVCSECEEDFFAYNFDKAGEYMVSVTASNNVSSMSDDCRIRVQEHIESVTLVCSNCKDSKYLSSNGSVADLELSATCAHGTSKSYSWKIDSESAVISVDNHYEKTLTEIRSYTVMVIVWNDVDSVNDSLTIIVQESIVGLYINGTSTEVLVGQSLTFHAEYSHGTDITFIWFVCAGCDTGNTSLRTYTHSYKTGGEYDVLLVAKNFVSEARASLKTYCLDTITDVVIHSNVSKKYVSTNQVVSFNVTLEEQIRVNLTWSIQLNNVPMLTETGWDVTYNFPVVGRYTVAISAMNQISSRGDKITLIAEDKIKNLVVTPEKYIVSVSGSVNITAETMYGSNVLFEWSVSNSSGAFVLPLSTELVTIVFTAPGIQTVTCEAANNVSDLTEEVQIIVQVPVIGVTIEGLKFAVIKSGQQITFTARVITGSELSYEWSINATNVQSTITHQFQHLFIKAGTFQLSLRVYNDISTNQTEETIIVQEMVKELSIKTTKKYVKTNLPIDFYAEFTKGSDLQFIWIFEDPGDKNTSHGDNVNHTYTSPGVFSVNLTATNKISSETVQIMIYAQDPVPNIIMQNCCGGTFEAHKPLSFTASKTGGTNVTFSQKILDGNNQELCQSEHSIIHCTFPASGVYTLNVDGKNDVSQNSRSYLVTVQTALHDITVNPEGPGWDYLYQGQSVKFIVSGNGVQDAHVFEWRIDSVSMTTTKPELEYVFMKVGSFSMTVIVKNRINSDSFNKSSTVHTFLCKIPVLEAIGDTTRVSYPSRSVELGVIVDSKNCSYYTAVHQWKVFSGICSDVKSASLNLPVSVYTRSPLLRLPKQVLLAGTYCVQFSSGYKETVLRESVLFNLTLEHSALVAVITGGDDILLPLSQSAILDGSMSYDPDSIKEEDSRLHFTWTCHYTPYQGVALPLPCFNTGNKFGKVVHVPEGILLPGFFYSIGLTVSTYKCIPGNDCRNGTGVQKIEISPAAVPTVDVDCLSCRVTNNFQISSNQHVALHGKCRNCRDSDGVQYLWTVTSSDPSALVNHLTLNSTTTTTGANASDLVIRKGVLQDGLAYTFMLEVTRSVTERGKASLTLQPNYPPSLGSCILYPLDNKVVPLNTLVTVVCDGWSDVGSVNSNLVYHISLERELPSGAVDHCVLYHGTHCNPSVYLSHWPDQTDGDIVTIRVDVQDEKGACTMALRRNIRLLSPVLMENQSLSEHIVQSALMQLRSLVQHHRPSVLLQYSMAVLMELNRASLMGNNSAEDQSRRAVLRLAITTALNNTPIQSVQDIQQLAYAVEQITMYKTEFTSPRYQIVLGQLVSRVIDIVHKSVKQGMDSDDFSPVHLLTALSNLMRTVGGVASHSSTVQEQTSINLSQFELTSNNPQHDLQGNDQQWKRRLATQVVSLCEDVMSYILMTKLPNEALSKVDLYDSSFIGKRFLPTHVQSVDNLRVVFPSSLISQFGDEEIFQIMSVMTRNPFVWGYEGNFIITSEVPTVLFQYRNGSEISIHSLNENIRIEMEASQKQQNNTDILSTAELERTNVTLQPNSSKKVTLDISLADQSTKSALHVHVRCTVLSLNAALNISELCSLYLGVDYEPSEKKYEEKAVITEDTMGDEDSQSYTFFIGSRVSPEEKSGPRKVNVHVLRFLSTFKPGSEYSLAVFNPSQDSSVEVSVGMYMSSCQFYSLVNEHWETQGCEVGQKSLPHRTICFCNHLTTFGASALVPPNAIDFTDLGRLSLSTNPIALITCCLLAAIYILLAFLCRRKDRKDIRHISKVPLCGLDGAFKYEVTVVTGRQLTAGTSAHIGIRLYGDDGKGGARHLCKPGAFRRNSQDTLLVTNDVNLGKLWKVLIWHDNAGLSPSWFLIQVVVRDLQTDQRYLFVANCWLSLQETNGFIQKEIIVSDPHQQWAFSRLCRSAFSRGICDQHLWMSVIDRPAQSRFSRVQRLTCCFTLLYTYMAVNIMWYGAIKTSPKRPGLNGWQYLSWEEIAVGTVSSLLVFPINILIAYIFRKTRSKDNMFELSEKPQTVEMEADCGLSLEDGTVRRDSLRRELTDFYGRESTDESIIPNKGGSLRRTNTLPILPSEDSGDSLYTTGSDSGVGSSRLKGQSSDSKDLWNVDSILNHWPNLPDVKSEVEFKQRDNGISVNKSLRISGIQVDDAHSDSDDGWASCLDDVEQADQSCTKPGTREGVKEWSLDDIDDKEKWKDIQREIFEDDLPKKDVKSKTEIELVDFTKTCQDNKNELKSGFNPRSEASLSTGKTRRRRSLSGPSRGLTQKVHPTSSIQNSRENTFDSVQANILFGRERTLSSISSRKGNRRDRRMSVASRISQRLHRVLLPRWCLLVAYGMCLILCAVSVLLILLYANQLGAVGTWRWILSLVLSFVLSVLVTEPLKVLFLAVFTAAVTKQVDEVEDEDAIEIQPSIESNEKFKDVKFRPLGGYALMNAKDEARKLNRAYTVIRQFLAYFSLLWLVVVIAQFNYNSDLYRLNQYVRNHYTKTAFNQSQTFNSIHSIPTFWQWCEDVLAPSLQITESGNNLYMGPIRFKQIRNKPTSCPAADQLSEYTLTEGWTDQCDRIPGFTEDTEPFLSENGTKWQYYTAIQLNDRYGVWLYSGWYGGGGYTQTISPYANNTDKLMADLRNIAWIDQRSRAVFIEWTEYNPALNVLCFIHITVEFPFTGKAVPSIETESFHLLNFSPGYVDSMMIFQILLMIVFVYLLTQCGLTLHRQRCSSLRSPSFWLDIAIVILMLTSLIFYVICVVTSTNTVQNFRNDSSQFISFKKTAYLHSWWRNTTAVLVFLVFLKVVQQFRFSKHLSLFQKTLSRALGDIMKIGLVFLFLLCTYGQLGYLIYGTTVYDYHNFQSSLLSLVGVIRGRVNFEPLLRLNSAFSYVFFYSLVFGVYGTMFCFICSVVRAAYKLTHSQMFYVHTRDTQDYEIIEFMLKRFKQLAGFTQPKAAFRRVRFAGLASLSTHSTVSFPSSQSSSSLVSYDIDALDPDENSDLDKLLARWEDVLMKMRQLEEMDKHEDYFSEQLCTVFKSESKEKELEVDQKSSDLLSTKPPKAPLVRSVSDSKTFKLFKIPGNKSRRKSVSPPSSTNKQTLARRPLSDQGARANTEDHKIGFFSRLFKKAW